ncbi:MAG: hypothetical protein JNK14_00740 [Chitinophagaceae bacterium]|nr:hypothetical protein [Chitinophagaceae bacterium]
MNGKLNQDIINQFKLKFEGNCIYLLLDAYNSLRNSNRKVSEESENNITAQLIGFVMESQLRLDLQITLTRENYLDTDETYDGLKDADKSPRIDFKYSVWSSNAEFEYYMEAKNLAENNWTKNSTGAIVDAYKLRKRYIETGIDNFTSGRYPNGCLLGYVLEGKSHKIVELLNRILITEKRAKEILVNNKAHNVSYSYYSKHDGTSSPLLKHFMLDLS